MERLADRGRVTSRMTKNDPTLLLHTPGVTMPLAGSERAGGQLLWRMTDFSAQLLKRIIQLAELSRNIGAQDRLLRLAEQSFEHLWKRRIDEDEGAGLWDNIRAVYPEAQDAGLRMSWSITERVTECLVAARILYEHEPIRSPELAELARELLSEATHLFGREQLEASTAADGAEPGPCGASRAASTTPAASSTNGPRPPSPWPCPCSRNSTPWPRPGRRRPGGVSVLVFAASDKGGTGRSVTSANLAYQRGPHR
ncbi:hypothetical protein STENM327S_01863 [Streptomyces tendae]